MPANPRGRPRVGAARSRHRRNIRDGRTCGAHGGAARVSNRRPGTKEREEGATERARAIEDKALNRSPIEVTPPLFIALNAYSTWYNRPVSQSRAVPSSEWSPRRPPRHTHKTRGAKQLRNCRQHLGTIKSRFPTTQSVRCVHLYREATQESAVRTTPPRPDVGAAARRVTRRSAVRVAYRAMHDVTQLYQNRRRRLKRRLEVKPPLHLSK